ncbi:chymotrypsin-like elastase family member 2A [Ptychodera flava]|uniref:chymotrypsin-like elastase family member 2A n=1 Tax=Ptychodera flava TaxID=63121 RepID=UPI00396A457C
MRILIILSLVAVAFGQDSGCGNDRNHFGLTGFFTSMNYDPPNYSRYDRNAHCEWVLETSVILGQAIQLEFEYFSVEAAPNCRYDSVTAYDGLDETAPILRVMCGHSPPNPTISTSQIMHVVFKTDGSVEYYGFHANWNARDVPVDCETGVTFRCGDDLTGFCIPIEERCDGVQNCPNGEDEIGCPSNSVRCGDQNIEPILSPGNGSLSIDVIGGYEAVPGSWPWIATLQQSYDHKCGATIINNRWVLTAASCVSLFRNNPQVYDIGTGNHIYTQPDPFEATHDVEEIFVHPDYAALKDDYNFALLKIRGVITFVNDWHLDICLPAQDDIYSAGTVTYVAGWGSTLAANFGTPVLLQNSVIIHSRDYCNNETRWNGDVTPSLICAGDEASDPCEGDDGGPMMWYRESEGKWYLVGVIGDRNSHECAMDNKPGLYGYVPNVVTWIEETLLNN